MGQTSQTTPPREIAIAVPRSVLNCPRRSWGLCNLCHKWKLHLGDMRQNFLSITPSSGPTGHTNTVHNTLNQARLSSQTPLGETRGSSNSLRAGMCQGRAWEGDSIQRPSEPCSRTPKPSMTASALWLSLLGDALSTETHTQLNGWAHGLGHGGSLPQVSWLCFCWTVLISP